MIELLEMIVCLGLRRDMAVHLCLCACVMQLFHYFKHLPEVVINHCVS